MKSTIKSIKSVKHAELNANYFTTEYQNGKLVRKPIATKIYLYTINGVSFIVHKIRTNPIQWNATEVTTGASLLHGGIMPFFPSTKRDMVQRASDYLSINANAVTIINTISRTLAEQAPTPVPEPERDCAHCAKMPCAISINGMSDLCNGSRFEAKDTTASV